MSTDITVKPSEKQYRALEIQVCKLLRALKPDICDDYRAHEDDECPGMCVTIGASVGENGELSWSYQTGDNSYSGGAYSHRFWGVIYLYRRSNCAELAKGAVSEIADGVCC